MSDIWAAASDWLKEVGKSGSPTFLLTYTASLFDINEAYNNALPSSRTPRLFNDLFRTFRLTRLFSDFY